MKRKNKLTKIIFALLVALSLCAAISFSSFAEETVEAEAIDGVPVESETEDEGNFFGEIYALAEANADKIFSALAFIGTLIVGLTYKSGLLPLLSDALGKFKGALEGIKSENERFESVTDGKLSDIGASMEEIVKAVQGTEQRMSDMEKTLVAYEESARERESMKIIIASQIDMLYSIFMASSLPHFEKEEIGNRIMKMREELNSCEERK